MGVVLKHFIDVPSTSLQHPFNIHKRLWSQDSINYLSFVFFLQQLKGKLYYCYGVAANTVHNKTECTQHPDGVWLNYQYNFDNLPEVMLLFTSMSSVLSPMGWVLYDLYVEKTKLENLLNFQCLREPSCFCHDTSAQAPFGHSAIRPQTLK